MAKLPHQSSGSMGERLTLLFHGGTIEMHLPKGLYGLPPGSGSKGSACNSGHLGSIPGWEDPLEKRRATHSSILAWRIPWSEEPGRLQSIGSQRVRHCRATNIFTFTHSFIKKMLNPFSRWGNRLPKVKRLTQGHTTAKRWGLASQPGMSDCRARSSHDHYAVCSAREGKVSGRSAVNPSTSSGLVLLGVGWGSWYVYFRGWLCAHSSSQLCLQTRVQRRRTLLCGDGPLLRINPGGLQPLCECCSYPQAAGTLGNPEGRPSKGSVEWLHGMRHIGLNPAF